MPELSVLGLSPRTASLLLAPRGTRFRLPTPLGWRLFQDGHEQARGLAKEAPLFFEGLAPDTDYELKTDIGALRFHTMPCTGLVDASDFGVAVDAADNAPALARAIAATPEGGTLLIPEGSYASGPIFLKAGITFYLPKGAALKALHDWHDWPIMPARDDQGRPLSSWEGLPENAFAALVTAVECPNLILTGQGSLDGGGDRGDWWSWPKETRLGARRPRTVFLARSNNVQLSGLTIGNSPSWTVHPFCCDRLRVSALRIVNPPDSPNTDGLNPESCTNSEITGVHFSVGDDCIAIKAGKRAPGRSDHLAPTRGLSVTHCHMARGHGGVVLGSEMSGDITDIRVAHCTFSGTDRGLRIKTRRGRGGRIARVHLEDVVMEDVATPFSANAFYYCDPDGHDDWVQDRRPATVDETTPEITDITLEKVSASGVKLAAAALLGLPERPISRVTLKDFLVSFDPEAEPGLPLMADGQKPVRHAMLIVSHADVEGRPQSLG